MKTRPYIIERGDTPATLAGALGLPKSAIHAANPISLGPDRKKP